MERSKIVHLDTHVLVLLYERRFERLDTAGRRAIDASVLVASPMAVLELDFMHEIGRVRQAASKIVQSLLAEVDLRVYDFPFRDVVDQAIGATWTRDPFDRLIVANAKAAGAQLLTADEGIRRNYARAIW